MELFSSKEHNSHLCKHKLLLLSNEGNQATWSCLQIFLLGAELPQLAILHSNPTENVECSDPSCSACLPVPGTGHPKAWPPAQAEEPRLCSFCSRAATALKSPRRPGRLGWSPAAPAWTWSQG